MPSKKGVDRSSPKGSHHLNRLRERKYQLKSKSSRKKFGVALRRSKMGHQRTLCSGGGRGSPSQCMTPEELCRYDDICTALVIDPYMGFQTHKMNIRFRPLSNQSELKKIVEDFIEDQDYNRAYDRLLSCDQRRIAPLIRTEREQNLLYQHIFCFLKMFDKDAGFEIKPCQRYSAEENQGGKIVATKSWKKHEYISMLVGCIGELTPQQEKDLLVCGQNDFSVMWSNRKKKSQLWLGPAAYMNHDCKPNCRFIPVGNTAYLQVIRDIAPGDEILLSYGDNFFGPDNCSCECSTCELTKRGAFKPKEDEIVEENSDRLRQIPSRISTRAERAMAKDNWNGRAQRLKAHAGLLNGEELKKRKLTKYDAQIILEGNHLLSETFHTPSAHVQKTLPHTSSHKGELSTDGFNVNIDACKTSNDSGEVNTEGGKESNDSGEVSTDGGKEGNDSGEVSTDFGKESYDSGEVSTDVGKESYDGGKVSTDVGKESYDSGEVSTDGGKASTDSGKVSTDGGKVEQDSDICTKTLSHTSSFKRELSIDDGKEEPVSDICTDIPSQGSSTSLVALIAHHGGETPFTAASPCVPRRQVKCSQMCFTKTKLKHSARTLAVGGREQTEKETWSEADGSEAASLALVETCCQDQGMDTAAGITTVQTAHLSPARNSVHCDAYSSYSLHPNGKLPLKNKTLNKEPVRQSPRLRPRRCSGQQEVDGEYMCSAVTDHSFVNEAEDFIEHPQVSHTPRALDVDNEDSGLGEMTGEVCDKSLDSNHNLHEPPVLEPQVPYLSPNPPGSLTPVHHRDGDSDQELNKSSSSVPSLPFCGPVVLTETSPGALPAVAPQKKTRKRKRKEQITLCIKLEHPDNDKKVDFYQRLEKDGKSRFVKIEPKEKQGVKQSACSGVSVNIEQRGVDSVRPSKVGEGHRSVAGPSRLVVGRPSSLQAAGSAESCTSQPALPPVKLKLRREMWQSFV